MIFEVSTGCGVPALLFYLTFFAVGWWIAVRGLRRRKQQPLPEWAETAYLAAGSGLVGYFVSSMFSSGAALETSYLLVSIGLAASLVLEQQGQELSAMPLDEHEDSDAAPDADNHAPLIPDRGVL